jgi:hypothetical protein
MRLNSHPEKFSSFSGERSRLGCGSARPHAEHCGAIRHAGTPASAKRILAVRDSTSASLLLLSFSGYLSPQIDEMIVLGV